MRAKAGVAFLLRHDAHGDRGTSPALYEGMHSKSDNELNETLRNNRRRSDDGNAFIPDPGSGAAHTNVDIAEELAEDFIAGATSNDDAASNLREAVSDDEMGGPFLEESPSGQFASGVDASNPDTATREAFPTAMRGAEDAED